MEDARRAKGLGRWKGKGRRRSKQLLFILSDTLRKREREKVQIARVVEFSLPLAAISNTMLLESPILSFDRALQEITTNSQLPHVSSVIFSSREKFKGRG